MYPNKSRIKVVQKLETYPSLTMEHEEKMHF